MRQTYIEGGGYGVEAECKGEERDGWNVLEILYWVHNEGECKEGDSGDEGLFGEDSWTNRVFDDCQTRAIDIQT